MCRLARPNLRPSTRGNPTLLSFVADGTAAQKSLRVTVLGGRLLVGIKLVQLDWGSRESWSAVGSSTSKTRPRVSEWDRSKEGVRSSFTNEHLFAAALALWFDRLRQPDVWKRDLFNCWTVQCPKSTHLAIRTVKANDLPPPDCWRSTESGRICYESPCCSHLITTDASSSSIAIWRVTPLASFQSPNKPIDVELAHIILSSSVFFSVLLSLKLSSWVALEYVDSRL